MAFGFRVKGELFDTVLSSFVSRWSSFWIPSASAFLFSVLSCPFLLAQGVHGIFKFSWNYSRWVISIQLSGLFCVFPLFILHSRSVKAGTSNQFFTVSHSCCLASCFAFYITSDRLFIMPGRCRGERTFNFEPCLRVCSEVYDLCEPVCLSPNTMICWSDPILPIGISCPRLGHDSTFCWFWETCAFDILTWCITFQSPVFVLQSGELVFLPSGQFQHTWRASVIHCNAWTWLGHRQQWQFFFHECVYLKCGIKPF